MSHRQTRNMYRSRLNTPVSSKIVKREKDESDEGSSTSADESGGEAWNSKNDGAVIKQAHYGGKRRRTGRGRGLRKGTVSTDKRRRKRVKSESIDVDPKEDKATQQEEEEINTATDQVEDQGNQAELEDEVPQQEPDTTTRRSGRATKTPERFDEERYQPYGAPAPPASRANISKALRKLKESRAPTSRPRGISPDGSPDPIASFSDDHDRDMEIDPIDQRPPGDILISTDLSHPTSDGGPPKSKMGRPRKSALKSKIPSGPRKKRGKVTIDESRNVTRTIKIISSTSSDIGRHPSLPNPRGRGPKKFGVRSRRTQPVMGISPYTGKTAVQSYKYVVSSDSTESEDEDMIDPAEFREWIKMKREQEKKNGAFLLTLAARISDPPNTSSPLFSVPSPPPPPVPPIPSTTLPPPPEVPVWTKPFSLTPIRPPPPLNPDHPSNQEKERVSFVAHEFELMVGLEYVC
jgi:hypothetical protein